MSILLDGEPLPSASQSICGRFCLRLRRRVAGPMEEACSPTTLRGLMVVRDEEIVTNAHVEVDSEIPMASEAILLTVMIRCTARVDLSSAATVYPLVLQQLMKFGMKKRKNENVGGATSQWIFAVQQPVGRCGKCDLSRNYCVQKSKASKRDVSRRLALLLICDSTDATR